VSLYGRSTIKLLVKGTFHDRQIVVGNAIACRALYGQRFSNRLRRGNLKLVMYADHARHALATMDTKLLVIERPDGSAKCYNSATTLDFQPSGSRNMPAHQIVGDAAAQFSVGFSLVRTGMRYHTTKPCRIQKGAGA